jgi:hypothetical protein
LRLQSVRPLAFPYILLRDFGKATHSLIRISS